MHLPDCAVVGIPSIEYALLNLDYEYHHKMTVICSPQNASVHQVSWYCSPRCTAVFIHDGQLPSFVIYALPVTRLLAIARARSLAQPCAASADTTTRRHAYRTSTPF